MTASGPDGNVLHMGDIARKTGYTLAQIDVILKVAGYCNDCDVVQTREYITINDRVSGNHKCEKKIPTKLSQINRFDCHRIIAH